MNELQRTLLSIASRLLHYPDRTLSHELQTVRDWAIPLENDSLRRKLMSVVDSFLSVDRERLQELYVSTFDWKETTGLYLTAHELGDSRKRGNALILLQRMIIEAGFEWPENELADYIPMLYELVAEMPETSRSHQSLVRRLASATQYIMEHLPDAHLYHNVFSLLMGYVFEAPSEKELKRLKEGREEADLGEMPYPIAFQ